MTSYHNYIQQIHILRDPIPPGGGGGGGGGGGAESARADFNFRELP